MSIPGIVGAQRDFSAGELNSDAKRQTNAEIVRAGLRQALNLRILNSSAAVQRPGKSAQYVTTGRVDQVRVLPALIYDMCFGGDGSIQVRDQTGAVVANLGAATYPWRTATVDQIVWAMVKVGALAVDVVICFPGLKTQVAHFDGVATWTFGAFAFDLDAVGTAQAPYYRLAPPNVTMFVSGTSGSVSLQASAAVFSLSPSSVGSIFRYAGNRLLITAVINTTQATATCIDSMPGTQPLQLTAAPTGVLQMNIGELVTGLTSGCQGIIVAIVSTTISVQIINTVKSGFSNAEVVTSATTKNSITAGGVGAIAAPSAIAVWDEQAISDAHGWPQSCFADQGRLGFCDLPGATDLILWSQLGLPYSFTIGAQPTQAIGEVITGKPRVLHVIPGAHAGDEIVFTDRGVYMVPISESNPLKPGSVIFKTITPEAASPVKPIRTSEAILYVNAGRNRVIAVVGAGAAYTTRPYSTKDVTEWHTHLFKTIKALAVSTGDTTFPESYVYALNTDGTLAVGKYDLTRNYLGWLPWTSAGVPNWISALASVVTFTTVYQPGAVSIAERLDDTQYLDGAIPINVQPSGLPIPGGKGPLWWLPGAVLDLMDGARPLGPHQIDANGFVVNNGGEDLSLLTLMAGYVWTMILEPFIAAPEPGTDQRQRMRRRRVSNFAVSVQQSNGFTMNKLFSGKQTPATLARGITYGTIMQQHRIPPWNQDDNANVAPILREETYTWRPLGRDFDPRCAVLKDTPGPLRVTEVGFEVSI